MAAAAAASFVLLRSRPRAYFQQIQLVPVTSVGNVTAQAISGDGKYVAYAAFAGEGDDVRVRQVKTGVDVEVVPSGPWHVKSISFSPDDYFLWVVRYLRSTNVAEVVQLPVVGGEPRRVLDDVDTAVAFSPDGKRVAFMRGHPRTGEWYSFVANVDGTEQRRLVTKKAPEAFLNEGPAWSPDGREVAFPSVSRSSAGAIVAGIDFIAYGTGKDRFVPTANDHPAGRLIWSHDGRALITSQYSELSRSWQIWVLPLADGTPRQITNDLNDYFDPVATSDFTVISARRSIFNARLWIADNPSASKSGWRTRPVQPAAGTIDRFAFTPDGKILYVDRQSAELAIMEADGSHARQLTSGAHAQYVAVCSQHAVYSLSAASTSALESGRAALGIYRVDPDGGGAQRLTNGADFAPDCSPDGRSVVFVRVENGHPTVWRVSVDGGEAERVTDIWSETPLYSPDGSRLAYATVPVRSDRMIVVRPAAEAGAEIRLGVGLTGLGLLFRWSPDGKGIDVVRRRDGVDNLWRLPLDGGLPRQLTSFDADRIYWFAWSPDGGKLLAALRGSEQSDVVLIRDSTAVR